MKKLNAREISHFQKIIWGYYKKHGRTLPWRRTRDPYKILVSEVMLQQTQVSRVLKFYPRFVKKFPTAEALSRASLRDVLAAWSGLGYNRRAKYLHEAAKSIVEKHRDVFPKTKEELTRLPGVGEGTAGAIRAFAFNDPAVFIETNIRAVFIHHFFARRETIREKYVRGVSKKHSNILQNVGMLSKRRRAEERRSGMIKDEELMPLIEQTLGKNPREWYYALMDYGAMLKQKFPNPSRRSVTYTRQTPFENSRRKIRGEIIKLLLAKGALPYASLLHRMNGKEKLLREAIQNLKNEGFLATHGKSVSIRRNIIPSQEDQ